MLQDSNSNPIRLHVRLRSFLFIGHTKDKEVYFLQQGWARPVVVNLFCIGTPI